MTLKPEDILESHWGYTSFKGSQLEVINGALSGKDSLVLMPTGGGKSLCYQIPALAQEGICIVVSPLIALIQDQVATLKDKGIKAVALTGGIPYTELGTLLDNCIYGNYKFLYLSPERLQQEVVKERIQLMNVNLVAIDEAHCISQWGNDFRPAYLECGILRTLKVETPIMALTATATPQVAEDIVQNLNLVTPLWVKDSFARKNISYQINHSEDKRYSLKKACEQIKRSGIVYVRRRRSAEDLATFLNKAGLPTAFFHGGISKNEKQEKLAGWLRHEYRIMVATTAFGMGIDKPDVEAVIHYEIPESLENYYQEAGRAGRDGQDARAILITNEADVLQVKKQFISTLPDIAFLKLLYNKLNNYFQIPYGEGADQDFQFHFNKFCDTYQLNPLLAYNGLTILDQQSIIALSQEFSKKSTVKFIAKKDQLFRYLEKNQSSAPTIQLMLRTYGGLFDFETKINTHLLAKKAQISEPKIEALLSQLEKDNIIDYTAQNRDLKITFLVPREDDITINSVASTVEAYQQVKIDKVASMIAFIKNTSQCREQQLLAYFGEIQEVNCGRCDNCKKRGSLASGIYSTIASDILKHLKEKEASSRKLIEQLPYESHQILEVLRDLLEQRQLHMNNKNEYVCTQ